MHRPLVAGNSGSEKEGADSVVLSGRYEDDEDLGEEIVYTGHGGRDAGTNRQVAHQRLTRANLALAYSCLNGLPVRVVHGANPASPHAPRSGYRYDGLCTVQRYWHEPGRSGFRVWRYLLRKVPDAPPSSGAVGETPGQYHAVARREVTEQRAVRDTPQARRIKGLHGHRCQMCGARIETPAGPYAEAAHITPLGAPHHGTDTPENILCLCPNHHVLFDHGGVTVADDLSLVGEPGRLRTHPAHPIALEHLRSHRERHLPLLDLVD